MHMIDKFIKVIVGPSAHYHQLKSGLLKYQKSKPANPVWRILILDEIKNLMHCRVFANKPSAEEIERVTMGTLAKDISTCDVVIPDTVERLCPGLQEKLLSIGFKVYIPAHGFASGARASREWEKILSSLGWSLECFREAMASCDEIANASGNELGIINVPLWLENTTEASKHDRIHELAKEITRRRGRDPEVGRQRRLNESYWAPLNKGKHVPPPEDVLTTLLSDQAALHLHETNRGRRVWDVVQQLKKISDAELRQKLPLLQNMGASVILHQIAEMGDQNHGFLSSLNVYLRDPALRHLVLLGVKEALKMLIVVENGLLQASAAKVTVNYPQNCTDLTLRSVPAHKKLEKMIQEISGGQVAIIPRLASCHPGAPEFLQGWGPFSLPWFSGHTQFSPSQCLVPVTKTGFQRKEGALIILAILPRDTARHVPIGDSELASQMTTMVNERLILNSKGVTCQINSMQTYGDIMDIGYPLQQ